MIWDGDAAFSYDTSAPQFTVVEEIDYNCKILHSKVDKYKQRVVVKYSK